MDHSPSSQSNDDVENFSQNPEDSSHSPGYIDNFNSKSLSIQPSDIPTKGILAFSILCDLLDECILDVAFEAHRETKLAASYQRLVTQPGLDIFGNRPQQNDSPKFECVNCKRPYPSKRYAPHLEKCLGLAGRSSSRVANLKIGNDRNPSSPYTTLSEDNLNQSDSDGGLYIEKFEKKRKKLNGKSRRSSPAKYTKSKKQKSITKSSTLSYSSENSTLDSPNSPIKRSFSMEYSDGSKNIQYKYNGNSASVDTSTQSDNDYIDIDGDYDTIEVLQTSNDSGYIIK
ncbi:11885_t:CDS:10 [Rhizophagus irregularis]|nr:11885_t:CDS:10 [Rhizophagus irregularis]